MSTTCASYELVNVYYLGFLWTFQCLLLGFLMNLSMSTTCASYELVNAHSHGASYELVHLQLSALTGTPKLFFECYPLIFKGHVLLWYGDFQRTCLTLMWWFCSAACLPYIETSLPQHRTESCLQTYTCWKLERDAWAALVWWTLFRDSCLEVFLANTETEMVMMLRLRLRLRLKPSAQGVECATHFGCRPAPRLIASKSTPT